MNRLTKRNGHYCDDCGYEPANFVLVTKKSQCMKD